MNAILNMQKSYVEQSRCMLQSF